MAYNPDRIPAGNPRDPRLDGCHPDYSPLHLEESARDWPQWPKSMVKYRVRESFKREIGGMVVRSVVAVSAAFTFKAAGTAIVSLLTADDTKNTSSS